MLPLFESLLMNHPFLDGNKRCFRGSAAFWSASTKTRTAAVGLAVVFLLFVPGCDRVSEVDQPSEVVYVGRKICGDCHVEQLDLWRGSHHDLAMQVADASTVLGDFDDATFSYAGVTSSFFQRDGKFVARTDGSDGELEDYVVAYTFGVTPLQQYLIEFPDGRIQALSICWDSRPAVEGGQRWFHLYPGEEIDHDDELHWTGLNQNWNFMCAECHSTRLRKGYDAGEDRFETTWAEIDVSCEACHGPGSSHVEWAESGEEQPNRGLIVQLADRDDGSWIIDPKTGSASRSVPRSSRAQLETCARCHSRRAIASEDYVHGRPLMDTHRPALLEQRLYHADGQILDEVYVYGSFLQSKMHGNGVNCTDCHDPHGLELHSAGNGTCTACHMGSKFDVPSHHFHGPDSPAAACVSCHMPSRNYMVVDPRHDHGFHIPRPDLSVKLGTPNACNDCHADRDAEWAADMVARWYGPDRATHYAEGLHAGRENLPGAESLVRRIVEDPDMPGIARATAASLLGRFLTTESLPAFQEALQHDDPLLRFGALQSVEALDPSLRARMAGPLLDDPIRAIRTEAGRLLAAVPQNLLDAKQRAQRDRALAEYRAAQALNADRPESHVNLGLLEMQLGNMEQAEREYRAAIRLRADYVPAHVNLSDLHRLQDRDDEGEQVLREALAIAPENAEVQHALGLLLVRRKRTDKAMPFLRQAAELRPEESRYGYVYGVALHSAGEPGRAVNVLGEVHGRHPGDRDVLLALATMSRDAGSLNEAVEYARKLLELAPTDPGVRQLLAELEAASR